jgi:hypothetical protein
MEFSIKLLYCRSKISKTRMIWPVPLSDIVNFIAYLEKMNYKASTAKSYISGLSFKMKVIAIQDTAKSFVITKMLSGMERKPITFEIFEKIINVLLHVCNSYYEATLFAACFSVAFYLWSCLQIIYHIFNWTNNPVVAGINHQFSCISQLIGF